MASFSKRGKYWRAQVRTKGQEGKSRTPRTFDAKAEAQVWARSAIASVPGAAAPCRQRAAFPHFRRVDLFADLPKTNPAQRPGFKRFRPVAHEWLAQAAIKNRAAQVGLAAGSVLALGMSEAD